MKKLIPALLLLILTAPATCLPATVPVCTPPVKPELPPQNPDSREMERTSRDMNVYIKEMTTYRNCLLKMVAAADSDVTSVVAGWNHAVELFKSKKGDVSGDSTEHR